MKKLLFLIIIFTSILTVSAQTVNVCKGVTKSYWVDKTIGSTYQWTLKTTQGVIKTGQGTDSITVEWNIATINDTVQVIETNAGGCLGATVTQAIQFTLPATATLSGTKTLCYNAAISEDVLKVVLVGVAPFTLTYSDGTNNTTVNSISGNTYFIRPTGSFIANKTFNIVSVLDANSCAGGTVSGTATVTVLPVMNTLLIKHN